MNSPRGGGRGRTLGIAAVVAGLSAFVAINTFQGPLEKAATDHKPTAQAMVEEQNPEQSKTTDETRQARNTTKPSAEEKQRSIERMSKTQNSKQDLASWLPWNWGSGTGGGKG
ncbi:MAG: hypothetical protein Q9162_005589 [Coniocarpon cinnabarinum]